jgi:hypothetical protein
MITLERVEPLFEDTSAIPQDTLKQVVLEDFRMNNLAGVPDNKLEISFNPEEGGDILVKLIDPHAATGYLVFQGEQAYRDWLNRELYEPSQDEIQEAARHGIRA